MDPMYLITINPNDSTYSNTIKCKGDQSTGCKIIEILHIGNYVYNCRIELSKSDEIIHSISEIIPIHISSYYVALKNIEHAYPRNILKSVTVK